MEVTAAAAADAFLLLLPLDFLDSVDFADLAGDGAVAAGRIVS